MTVAAVTMVRDEADIIGSTVRHMLTQVDFVIVADNRSVDLTPDILAGIAREHPGRLLIVDDAVIAYTQAAKMTQLARLAHELGADWIVPFDADEIWYAPHDTDIATQLDAIAPQWLAVSADLYDHVATAEDPAIADPVRRIGWRKCLPAELPKVAVRWRDDLVIHQGNHGATYTGGTTIHPVRLVVRHFPYRSAEQVIRKIRNGAEAYRTAGDAVAADAGAHWRQWGEILDRDGPDAIADLFRTWHWRSDPRPHHRDLPALMFDPAPVVPVD